MVHTRLDSRLESDSNHRSVSACLVDHHMLRSGDSGANSDLALWKHKPLKGCFSFQKVHVYINQTQLMNWVKPKLPAYPLSVHIVSDTCNLYSVFCILYSVCVFLHTKNKINNICNHRRIPVYYTNGPL